MQIYMQNAKPPSQCPKTMHCHGANANTLSSAVVNPSVTSYLRNSTSSQTYVRSARTSSKSQPYARADGSRHHRRRQARRQQPRRPALQHNRRQPRRRVVPVHRIIERAVPAVPREARLTRVRHSHVIPQHAALQHGAGDADGPVGVGAAVAAGGDVVAVGDDGVALRVVLFGVYGGVVGGVEVGAVGEVDAAGAGAAGADGVAVVGGVAAEEGGGGAEAEVDEGLLGGDGGEGRAVHDGGVLAALVGRDEGLGGGGLAWRALCRGWSAFSLESGRSRKGQVKVLPGLTVPLGQLSVVSAEESMAKITSTARLGWMSGFRGMFWRSSPPSTMVRVSVWALRFVALL